MRNIIRHIVPLCLVAAALSCSKTDINVGGGTGYLSTRVQEDGSLDVVVPSLKSDGRVYSLSVYDATNTVVASTEDCTAYADSPLELPVGPYSAVASSTTGGSSAAFGEPFYTGTVDFRINRDETTNIEIPVTIANTKVTVQYSDDILSGFSVRDFRVSNGQGGELLYSISEGTEEGEGYFAVSGTLTWTLSLTNTDGVKYQDLTGTLTDVQGGHHYAFSFTLGQSEDMSGVGAGYLTIILDDSMNTTEHNLYIDLTGSPELTPSFSDGFVAVAGDSSQKTVSIEAENGLRSLILTYPAVTRAQTQVELVGADDATISALASIGIVTSSVQTGAVEASVDFTDFIASLPEGDYTIGLLATDESDNFTDQSYNFSIVPDYDVVAMSADPWARFATLTGRWLSPTMPDGITVQYRRSNSSEWIDYTGELNINSASSTFTAELRGLSARTSYAFRVISANSAQTPEVTFVTEAEPVVPNMSFDGWYQDGNVWYPNTDANNFYWDSANGGTSSLSIFPTNPEDDHVVSGRAAKLESKSAPLVGLAAGNIYTGRFVRAVISITNPGAELDWGVPFTGRPLALKGYYDYRPVTVGTGDHAGMSGKTDIGQIQVILTDWDSPFRVNTQTSTFVDPNTDSGIIAYGTIDLNETSDYNEFTIDLDYRSTTRTPTYIVIVAAASKYGDYFTGGVGSTLYLDELSFEYDPDNL